MSVRSEVHRLADLVAAARSPLTTWEERLHKALRQINEVDIAWWERRYRHVHWHGSSELNLQPTKTVDLFDAIFDFGSSNLYTTFNEQRTAKEHDHLIRRLTAELEFEVVSGFPPTDW